MELKIFRYEQPHAFIREFREIKSDGENDPLLTHFVPPLGYPEIVFFIGNRSQIKNTTAVDGFIKGQYNIPQKIDFRPGYHFFSIVLHPYGLKQLLNINAEALVNGVLAPEEHPLTSVLAKLLADKTEIGATLISELEFLMQQCPLQPVSDSTLSFLKLAEEAPENKINTLLAAEGIKIRTLQRKFKAEVGLTPKEFLRITRMNQVEGAFALKAEPLQIVADFDFTDHSHFIRECKQLRSFTPKELVSKKMLLSDQLPAPEHIKI